MFLPEKFLTEKLLFVFEKDCPLNFKIPLEFLERFINFKTFLGSTFKQHPKLG